MNPETIIPLIITSATAFYDLLTKRRDIASARQKAIGELFTIIADTLQKAVDEFKIGKIPHGACAELGHYASNLSSTLYGVLPDEKVQYYGNMLIQAHNVEMLALTLTENREMQLADLERAAGIFRGIATTIKL